LRRIFVVALLALAAFAAFQALTWPDVAALALRDPETTAFLERHRERTGDRVELAWVPYARISQTVKRAVLVGEDINFFSHSGFEVTELRSAVEEAIAQHEVPRGASTITQQLAKNLWLSPSRNPWRKVKEAILTWQLERSLDKKRILEIYLNVAELGDGIYGVGPAAKKYFGKSAAELDEREAAELAASLPKPDSWHPGSKSAAYARHVERILRRMEKASFLWRQVGAGANLAPRLDLSRQGSGRMEES
jgi:monofunctional biosynthetic peptidoglycan transglycosylase